MRAAAVGGAAVVIGLAVAAGLVSSSGAGVRAPGSTTAAPPAVRVVTYRYTNGTALPTAIMSGTLLLREQCLYLADVAGEDLLVVWASGTEFRTADRSLVRAGEMLATVGERLMLGGGIVYPGVASDTRGCRHGADVAMVWPSKT